MDRKSLHPEIVNAIQHHKEFFDGKRQYLYKVTIKGIDSSSFEMMKDRKISPEFEKRAQMLVPEIPYDGLDWDKQFKDYYTSRIYNAKIRASYRLDLKLGDDYIPSYYPYFGIGIHDACFGSQIHFGGGTSYTDSIITSADQYEQLHYSMDNVWIKRLTEAMVYCREHGDGVVLASLRGGNGPFDMANGVMGNDFFMELINDEENMHKVLKICTEACDAIYQTQQACADIVEGGTIAGQGNLWMPSPMFGHVSSDASHMTGPAMYEEFEQPYIEQLAQKYQGFLFHTHMMGWRMFDVFAQTQGIDIIRPVNDPNQPQIVEKIDDLLTLVNDKALMIPLSHSDIATVVPKFRKKRAIFELTADDYEDAKLQLDTIRTILE